jgi:hypothetical protein
MEKEEQTGSKLDMKLRSRLEIEDGQKQEKRGHWRTSRAYRRRRNRLGI